MTEEIIDEIINEVGSTNKGSLGRSSVFSVYMPNSLSNENSGEFTALIDNPQRKELLAQQITGITIGFSTLTPNWATIKYAIALIFKKKITQYFPPLLYHASILLHQDEESKNGIIIEYGEYNYNEDIANHSEKVHYWDKDGLRFSKMAYEQYEKYVKPLTLGCKYHYINCKIERTMTVGELINLGEKKSI